MNDNIKSWLFVTVQLVLLVALIFFTGSSNLPSREVIVIGQALELIGVVVLLVSFYDLRKSLTALPLPKQHGVLQIRGLYKYVRHPMYVGVLILCFGAAVSSGSLQKYLIVVGLLILFNFKARYEEKLLVIKYPEYKKYMEKTRRFIPISIKS